MGLKGAMSRVEPRLRRVHVVMTLSGVVMVLMQRSGGTCLAGDLVWLAEVARDHSTVGQRRVGGCERYFCALMVMVAMKG